MYPMTYQTVRMFVCGAPVVARGFDGVLECRNPQGWGLDTRQAYMGLLNMGLLKMGLPKTCCALPSLGAQGLLLRHCACKAYSLANVRTRAELPL